MLPRSHGDRKQAGEGRQGDREQAGEGRQGDRGHAGEGRQGDTGQSSALVPAGGILALLGLHMLHAP